MTIRIKGAREHNLKDINVEIGDGLTAVTGVSGSGKTSLVVDTLYHEARRRLYNVISTSRPAGWRYQLTPAQVDSIEGLGPALAVEQNILNRNPNSTLASASGLHPFFRLLYAVYGTRSCSSCSASLIYRTEDEIVEFVHSNSQNGEVRVHSVLLQAVKGSHRSLIKHLVQEFGQDNLWVDGVPWDGTDLESDTEHTIEVDLVCIYQATGLTDIRSLVKKGLALGSNVIRLDAGSEKTVFANAPVCGHCGRWFDDLEPKHFHIRCPYCSGTGCDQCRQTGIHPLAANVSWEGLTFPETLSLSVAEADQLFRSTFLPASANRLLKEINTRLNALIRVGLGYLSLDRASPSLSRGEAQRVRLAVTLTSNLEDILHVLDEPTIGQHPADIARFMPALRELLGPVIYIEHDRAAVIQADTVLDIGPGAGEDGGQVVFKGSPLELRQADTITGRYFSGREVADLPTVRENAQQFITLRGAYKHNLKNIDIQIPIQRLTVITGVSGSGKSTLVEHVITPSLRNKTPVGCQSIEGENLIPIIVDQSPIGRNPRSNPATYTKLADIIRDIFSQQTGISSSHFSFNRPEGACPTCKGMGAIEVKMQFLPSVWITCNDCGGLRFKQEVLDIYLVLAGHKYNIADIYQMNIQEFSRLLAIDQTIPPSQKNNAQRVLGAFLEVHLGYLSLGQPSTTLSGGEAQRVKLTKYLGRPQLGDRLIILDEPSTGLHMKDLGGLLNILERLVNSGATLLIVEHNTDIIKAADWVVDLGPGAGVEGGSVIYCGSCDQFLNFPGSITAEAIRREDSYSPQKSNKRQRSAHSHLICIRNARANNLQGVTLEIPKRKLNVVTGLSGSGKSSLVHDVLEAEARRRYLETMSLYERQGTREGPEAMVDVVTGLGVTLTVKGPQAHAWSALSHFTRRASVGVTTELSFHLAVLLSFLGVRKCLNCGNEMQRRDIWCCLRCSAEAEILKPRHFSTSHYGSVCKKCTGMGVIFSPEPGKLIIHPDKPLCKGAMYSPGYWPQSYLCKDTGIMQALGVKYGFNPEKTPWIEMSKKARDAFLFGDDEPIVRTYRSKSSGELVTVEERWEGFYGGWVRDWDVHGTYTSQVPCTACGGTGFRPEITAVKLSGYHLHGLCEIPIYELYQILEGIIIPAQQVLFVGSSLRIIRKKLQFLNQVGLGYLTLNRPTGTLSAGEIQRIQLASILGSNLTSLTILLDEPSRGMHPSELRALLGALIELRDAGNTVIVVEHDLDIIQNADHVIDMGPGAGIYGGKVIAQGSPAEIAKKDSFTGKWLAAAHTGKSLANLTRQEINNSKSGNPERWLVVRGATDNNLKGEVLNIPLGKLVGVCGLSGSGKSTLFLDTLGRALVSKKHSTSFSYEPITPGKHQSITGAPGRTILVDQSRKEIHSPAVFLGLIKPLTELYAQSSDAIALGMEVNDLNRRCSTCKGRGVTRIEMGFLPDILDECEICRGTGYLPEAWQIHLKGVPLPEINHLTLDEVYELFQENPKLSNTLNLAREVGLGYLVWRQPGFSLSGGEAQRLKIVKELCRKTFKETLYILDEPTVGQHMEDISRLIEVLQRLVRAGHTVIVIEHNSYVLAACDWLIEMGPVGGPAGGYILAGCQPEELAGMDTPTSPFIRKSLLGV